MQIRKRHCSTDSHLESQLPRERSCLILQDGAEVSSADEFGDNKHLRVVFAKSHKLNNIGMTELAVNGIRSASIL